MSAQNYERFWGLLLIASVVFAFGYGIYRENIESSIESSDQHIEAYKPKLFKVITRGATYENLKRAGSGEYETPDGKRIDFNEPYTEFEQ